MRTVLVATVIATAVIVPSKQSHAERPNGGRAANVANDEHDVDIDSAYALEWIARDYYEQQWIEGVQRYEREVAEYVAGVQRAQAAARRYPTGNRGGVGECTGFAIPDYIIQRESGGQPFVWNTQGSGAFGCAQTLITHYSSGQCSIYDKLERGALDPYTIEGQRECVNRLSNGGTNLNPWAQTR